MERAPFCIGCLSAAAAARGPTLKDTADAFQGIAITTVGYVAIYGLVAVRNGLCEHCRARVDRVAPLGALADPRSRA